MLSLHWLLEFLKAWKTGPGETEARHKKHFFFPISMPVCSFLNFISLVSENVAFLDMLDILVGKRVTTSSKFSGYKSLKSTDRKQDKREGC